MSKFVGIDISKLTFDVYFKHEGKGNYIKLNQTVEGYKVLISLIGRNRVCVMESTGNYHVKLADYLFQEGIQVVVENPLKIKRYSQMRLQRTKTDKADSQIIFEYGETILSQEEYHAWKPDSTHIGDLKQYDTVRQQLLKQQTALSNTEEALACLNDLNKDVTKVLNDMVKAVEKSD
ncbi:transposase [Mariprofundus ferrooxydans]|nr:transposase [Mariprofundus ferrooxydans]